MKTIRCPNYRLGLCHAKECVNAGQCQHKRKNENDV
jgi:hypothetical protein